MSDPAERMKADALEAQRFSRKHLVLELDFSQASIDQLESNVDSIEYAIKGGLTEDNVAMLSRVWGAYIGEAIRKQRGGAWREEEGGLLLKTDKGSAKPQEHVRKRLTAGGKHLGDYFREMMEQL